MFLLRRGAESQNTNEKNNRSSNNEYFLNFNNTGSSSVMRTATAATTQGLQKFFHLKESEEAADINEIITEHEFKQIVNFRRLFEHIKRTEDTVQGENVKIQKLLIFCEDAEKLLIAMEEPFIKAYGVDAYNQIEEEFHMVSKRIRTNHKEDVSTKYHTKSSNSFSQLPDIESIMTCTSNIQKQLLDQRRNESSLIEEYGELLEEVEETTIDEDVEDQDKTTEELSKLTSMLKQKAIEVNQAIQTDVNMMKRSSVILEKNKSALETAQQRLDLQIDTAKSYLYSHMVFLIVVIVSFLAMIVIISIFPRLV
ncbi:hypothetical protein C9374_004248 [Naegleria lovaniensis]|uniref:Uncharacterized protein n=1 Tax=Naegleria lovaniensis TaxID=51637 RepID=A0AA88GS54_NAELO|nr:uncharacterized protein C9374_004248 [Naegleria lovaniensis]KAG2383577.1 hypothetical protein C9374_004248 [Naegleria lovaniensis]